MLRCGQHAFVEGEAKPDRRAGFPRHQRDQRFHLAIRLAAETAAHGQGVNTNVVQPEPEDACDVGSDHERVLVAGPHFQPVARPACDIDVGFQVEVMNAGEVEAVGEHRHRCRERLVHVAIAEGIFGQHVLRRLRGAGGACPGRRHAALGRVIEQCRRIRCECCFGRHQRRQDLVIHHDRPGGPEGSLFITSNDRRDGVTDVADPIGRDHRLIVERHAVERIGEDRGVLPGQHHGHAGNGSRGGGIDAQDTGVGVRTAQQLAVQHAGQRYVESVGGTPGHAVTRGGGKRRGGDAVHHAAASARGFAAIRRAARRTAFRIAV